MNVPGYKSSLLLAVITVATEIFSACIESGEIKTDQTMPIFSVFGRLGEWDSLILSMVFVGVTAILMYRRRRERMTLLKTCGIPGPTPHFFIGNLKQCFSQGNVQFDTELTEKYGDICGYYMGAKPIILISDPILLKIIEVEQAANFRNRPRRVPGGINPDPKRSQMLGNLPYKEWHETRKVLTKAFTPSKLGNMVPQIQDKIGIFMDKLNIASETGDIDLYPLFQALTLDIIGTTGFGVDCNIQQNPGDPLHLAVQAEFAKSPNSFLVKFYLCLPEFSWILQPFRVGWYRIQEWLETYCSFSSNESNKLWEEGFRNFRERVVNQRERPDILQQLLDSHLSTNPLRVVANSVLFFEAAYETLSSGLAFATHFLVNYPHIQAKVREELFQVLGEDKLDNGHLVRLKYMEMMIKEVLRFYPPQTTFIGRSGDKPITYERERDGQTFTIPAGVHVQAGLYQLHHNPNIWPNPDKFDPDRFSNGNAEEKEGKWQAFGRGPRTCLGESFAWKVLKLVLGNILLKYELVPSPNLTEEGGKVTLKYKVATMTPQNGSWARLRPLEWKKYSCN